MSTEQKALARKAAFAARKIAHASVPGQVMTDALLAAIGPVHGQIIAGYMPIRTEADPVPAMTQLAEHNRICVPVIEAMGQPLRFRQWHPGVKMVEGAFGALIPATGDWLEPDVVIVPLVGFDRALNRLGYGGGFYDRTLEGLRARQSLRAIGFAFAAQELAELPLEPTDQRLDQVVTEHGPLAQPPFTA